MSTRNKIILFRASNKILKLSKKPSKIYLVTPPIITTFSKSINVSLGFVKSGKKASI